ncbi:D-TA family PLP-dependent enzyme [Pelagibius litoralis]|uniref:D-TA family PLP-dependent enzyme n=1 Tax=Pelagibius litoralis TaxID=374515 RepID=A0A967F009_9PROT|nr:D-TA family PLP-dependent enzyme [Pelagibius litoralis]NIA70565.1 D-TA family PLP-dependent enzyme [Pelagibius litoralis]
MKVDDIETPAVVIDEAVARRNIEQYQAHCNQHGLSLRPHIKTHKLPHFAKAQIAAGAVGITCQKLSEAEVMADHGLDDILITYNILGSAKLARLRRLAERLGKVCVTADNPVVIEGLSAAFADAPRALPVMVECDSGAHRCGVASPEEAVTLAQAISSSPGLAFAGLMTYPAVGGGAQVQAFMAEAKRLLAAVGLDCPVVSSGGSPDMWTSGEVEGVTEYRIGTYIYNDRSLVQHGVRSWEDCALTVLATVVSLPATGRAIIDAGSKTLTSDLIGLRGYGQVLGHDDVEVSALSEEHGILAWAGGKKLHVGQRIHIVPNHACVVSNMVDFVWIKSEAGRVEKFTVAARGGIT